MKLLRCGGAVCPNQSHPNRVLYLKHQRRYSVAAWDTVALERRSWFLTWGALPPPPVNSICRGSLGLQATFELCLVSMVRADSYMRMHSCVYQMFWIFVYSRGRLWRPLTTTLEAKSNIWVSPRVKQQQSYHDVVINHKGGRFFLDTPVPRRRACQLHMFQFELLWNKKKEFWKCVYGNLFHIQKR